jgi:hypothetical protein
MDFTVDQANLNFIDPSVPKLDSLEHYNSDRFSIPQLQCCYDELSMIARSTGDMMQCSELSFMMFSKIKLTATSGSYGESGLPTSWKSFGFT